MIIDAIISGWPRNEHDNGQHHSYNNRNSKKKTSTRQRLSQMVAMIFGQLFRYLFDMNASS